MIERKTFEHKVAERAYQFICDNDSPLSEIKDALCHFVAYMVNFEQSVISEMKNKQDQQVCENDKLTQDP